MKRKRFFSSGEKLEQKTKRLDALAKSRNERTEQEIEQSLGGRFHRTKVKPNVGTWKEYKVRLDREALEREEIAKQKAFSDKQRLERERDWDFLQRLKQVNLRKE